MDNLSKCELLLTNGNIKNNIWNWKELIRTISGIAKNSSNGNQRHRGQRHEYG